MKLVGAAKLAAIELIMLHQRARRLFRIGGFGVMFCGEALFGGGTLFSASNTARQESPSRAAFSRRQATIRFSSGISALHSRNTSGVQANCCSKVPRCSCACVGFGMTKEAARHSANHRDLFLFISSLQDRKKSGTCRADAQWTGHP